MILNLIKRVSILKMEWKKLNRVKNLVNSKAVGIVIVSVRINIRICIIISVRMSIVFIRINLVMNILNMVNKVNNRNKI